MPSGWHRRKVKPEEALHASIAQYLDLALPQHATWTTFPAGGGGRLRGAILKGAGLRTGWPDIQILVRNSPYDSALPSSRFIGFELKRPSGGTVSQKQIATHAAIRNSGGEVYVVRSIEEVYQALTEKEHLKLKAVPFVKASTPVGRMAKNSAAQPSQGSQKS